MVKRGSSLRNAVVAARKTGGGVLREANGNGVGGPGGALAGGGVVKSAGEKNIKSVLLLEVGGWGG